MSTSTALARCSLAVLLASSAGLASAATLDGSGQAGFDTNIPIATQAGRNDTVNITIGNTSGTVTLGTDLVLPGSATGIQLNFVADTGTPRETARFIVNNNAMLEIGEGAAVNFGNNGWFNVGFGAGQTGSVLLSGGTVNITNAGNVSYLDIGNAGNGTFTQTSGSVEVLNSALQIGVNGGTGVYDLQGGSVALNGGSTLYLGSGTVATAGDGTLNISGSATFTTDAQIFIGGNRGGTGTISQDGAESVVSLNTITSRSIIIGSGGGTGTYDLSAGTLLIGANGVTFGAAASSTGNFIQSGGSFTSAGLVSMGNGGTATYEITGGSSTMDGGLRLANGGTGSMVQSDDPDIDGTTTVIIGGAGIAFGNGTNSYELAGGTLTLADITGGNVNSDFIFSGGTLIASQSFVTSLTFATELSTDTSSTIDTNSFDVGWASPISGGGDLSKAGLGTLTLSAANTFTGDVDITAGTLALSNYAALQGNDVAISSGATLSLQPLAAGTLPTTVLAGEVSGAGTIDLGDAWFETTIGAGRTVAFSGTILSDTYGYQSAYGRFTKDGAGTLDISGSNMQKGEAYVTAGSMLQASGVTNWDTLAIGSGGGATGTLNVTGGDINFGVGLRIGDWGGTGSLVQTGGAVTLNPDCGDAARCASLNVGNQGGTGTYTISGGSLTLVGGRHSIGRNAGSNSGGGGTLNINGGLVEMQADGDPLLGRGEFIIGDSDLNSSGAEASGTVNQTGGTWSVVSDFKVFLGGYGTSIYNFTGGTLQIGGASLNGAYGNNGIGNYTFNFGNGVIDVTGTALTTNVNATLTAGTTATIDTNLLGASWGGILSGTGTLKKIGDSTLTLGGVNTFTGAIALNEGTLALSNAGALNGNKVTLGAGTALSIAPLAANAIVQAGEISGNATNSIDLGDSWLVTTVGAGNTAAYSGTVISANPAYTSPYGRFIKAGAGDLNISGATMTGGEGQVVGGRLLQTSGTTTWDTMAVGTSVGGTGDLAVSGGQLNVGIGLRVGDWGGIGTVTQTGGTVKVEATCGDDERCAALNIGNQGGTGTYTISNGTLRLVGGSNSIGRNAGSNAGGTGTLQINGGLVSVEAHTDPEFGNGAIVIGDLTASSVAEATGIINQTGGILRMGAGSTLNLAGYGSGTYNLSGGSLEIGGSSLQGAVGNNLEGTYAFNLGGGVIDVTGSALTTAVNATLVAGTTSTIDTNALGATWSGVISGSGGLVKTGASTLALSGLNTFTGDLTVNQGAVSITDDRNLGAASSELTLNGSTLIATGIVELDAARTVTLGASGGTFDTAGATTLEFFSAIGGAGGLTKTGAGTLVLSGANSYAGGTTVSQGVLGIGSATTTLVGNIVNNSQVLFNFGDADPARVFSNIISGTGVVGIFGNAEIVFDTAQTYTGNTIIGGDASLQIGNGGTTGSVAGNIYNDAALSFNRSDNVVYGGAITGVETTATLTKLNTNTLTLTGTSSYAGSVDVAAGSLRLNGGALTGGGDVIVQSGASFGGTGTVAGAVTVHDDGAITNGSAGAQLAVGALNLNSTSTVQAYLGATDGDELFKVAGALTLDGNLDVMSAANGAGVYKLMTYGGALTNNGLNIRLLPDDFRASLNLNVAGEVRLGLADDDGYQSWTANGSTTTGGSGTWTSDSATWLDQGGNVISAWGGTVGVFDGTAGTVTVAGVQQFTTLEFVTNGYVLTPQTISAGLSFTDGGTLWTEGADVTATVGTTIMGNGGLKKVGTGTLILSGTNTYTGGTRVEAGTLSVSSDANLGVGGITLVNGSALAASANFTSSRAIALEGGGIIATQGELSLSGSITGTGGLTKSGAGTVILSGTNSYAGGTIIAGGTLQIGNGNTSGSILGNVATVGVASSLSFNRSDNVTFSGNVSGDGNIRQDGTGILTLSGTNTNTGVVTVASGVLATSGGNAIGDSSLLSVDTEVRLGANETVGNIAGNGIFNLGSFTLTTGGAGGTRGLGGSLQGTGSLVKTGSGIVILGGVNTYTGTTTVLSGRLASTGSSLSDTALLTVASGAIASFQTTDETIGSLTGAGTILLNGVDLILGGDNSSTTFSGAFADNSMPGGFTKTGTGTFTVSGTSTNTGDTTVAGGTLLVSGTLGSGALNVESGATLGGSGSIGGTVTIANGGTLTNVSAGTRLSVGALALNTSSTVQAYFGTTPNTELYTVAGDLTLDGNLDILGAGNGAGVYKLMTYGGALTNNGMDIRAVPTGYRAGINVATAGEVRVGLADAAGFQYWTADGSTTHGGAGTWTADSQTWVDQDGNVVSSWAGTVGVFDGTAGTVTVSGMQQFQTLEFLTTGYTLSPQTISAGLNFTGGGQLWTEGAGVVATVATNISGTGGLKKVGAGTLILSGTNSYTGGTRVEAGTLSISNDANLGGVGGLTLANGSTLAATASFSSSRNVALEAGGTIATQGELSLSGVISGTGGLTKADAGTLILAGANTYVGGTSVAGGTLQIGNGATSGSILGNVTTSTGSALAFNRSDDIAFGGIISGTGNVVKDGAGMLTLSGNNTYSGSTTVAQGVLVTAGGNAIGDTSTVDITTELQLGANETVGDITGSGLISLGSYALTTGGAGGTAEFTGSLEGTGSLIKTGSGTTTLSGTNTYTGATTVQSGTLAVSGGSSLSDTARLTVATGATTNFQTNETIGSLAGGGAVGLEGITLTLGGDNTSSVFSGAFADLTGQAGGFTKTGTGTFEVSGISTNTGANSLSGGTLLVSGTLGSGALTVASGATLTGGGTIGGAVTVESGGTLVGGYLGGLTMGALTLDAGATTNVTLGAPNAPDSIFYVNGALNAAGTLNVAGTPQYGTGVYRVFSATGGVTDNGLTLGTTPFGGVDTALDITANTVDLQVTEIGEALQYWSANGGTAGGSGTWTSSNLWLYPNDRPDIWLGNVAIFDGPAGTVTVEGTQSFKTLEFLADGYVVNAGTGGALNVGTEASLLWAEGADVTATINAPIVGTGAVGKVGAGTIVLTGNNTYSGGTAILAGTLSVSADANLGAASGGIALAGGGTLATTASFASARNIELVAPSVADSSSGLSGTGTLTKIGGVALTLSGANTYTGGTVITGGSLVLDPASSSTLTVARAAAPTATGGIIDTVGAPTTLTLSGVISGGGDLVKTGLGTLILTGNNTYTGLTTISEGALQIGNGGTSGTIIGDIVNDALLVFARSDTYAFPGSISGTGTVNFNGGTVVFASPESFTGPINVNGSMVQLVNGSVSYSPFTINDGGTIGGSGTIGALTVNSGGTVAPGYSPGTLNVTGNVAFNAGSTYAVDVTPTGAHDLITAGGNVTINGGSAVDVLAEAGVYAATQTYAIITAGGTVAGAFGTVSSDFAFLTPSLSYDAQNVYLTLDYNNIDFAAFATTSNQAAVANAAQSLGFDNPVFDAIFSMSADELPAAFNSLSGEIGASAKGVLVNDSQFVRNAVFERLVTAGSVAPSGMSVAPLGYAAPAKPGVPYPTKAEPMVAAAPTGAFWAQGFGSWGSTDGNGNAASINRDTGGFLIGADTLVGDWRLGALGGYSQTSFDVDARSSTGTSDNIHAGIYAGTNWGAVAFRAGAAYSWNDISTSRNVNIPTPQLIEADYDAGTAQVFGELGYGLAWGSVNFEPFAGLAYVNLNTDGFSETGGPAALTSSSDSTDATYTTLGLRASTTFETGAYTTTLRGMLGWRHAFGDVTPTTAYQFAAGGSPFTVEGLPIAEDALVLDFGLDIALTDAASLGVFYSAQFGDSAQDQSVRGTLNWKF